MLDSGGIGLVLWPLEDEGIHGWLASKRKQQKACAGQGPASERWRDNGHRWNHFLCSNKVDTCDNGESVGLLLYKKVVEL